MNPALITIIENSKTNLGEGGSRIRPENMEREAIITFTAWRKNGGEFKDIPIYCFCPTKRVPERENIKKLEDLGVTYIEHYLSETDNFTCGYWNVPVGCMFLEENLKEDFLIHTDLDLMLLRPPPKELFYIDKEYLAKIGTIKTCRTINPEYEMNFETCFINSWRENSFYKIWYEKLKKLEKEFNDEGITGDTENFRYSEIEEHVIDIMYFEEDYKIVPIEHFQIGSWYLVKDIPDINTVYFHHDHLEGTPNAQKRGRELKNYIKRMRKGK